jgi:hypothetical protein
VIRSNLCAFGQSCADPLGILVDYRAGMSQARSRPGTPYATVANGKVATLTQRF